MTTRIAVIGLGAIAVEHLGAYQRNEQAELVAVCDVDLERAKARAERFDVPWATGDYTELLSREDVDAVSVCVPATPHGPSSFGGGGSFIPSGWPDSIRVISGSGPVLPIFIGVWQSLHPTTVTR